MSVDPAHVPGTCTWPAGQTVQARQTLSAVSVHSAAVYSSGPHVEHVEHTELTPVLHGETSNSPLSQTAHSAHSLSADSLHGTASYCVDVQLVHGEHCRSEIEVGGTDSHVSAAHAGVKSRQLKSAEYVAADV